MCVVEHRKKTFNWMSFKWCGIFDRDSASFQMVKVAKLFPSSQPSGPGKCRGANLGLKNRNGACFGRFCSHACLSYGVMIQTFFCPCYTELLRRILYGSETTPVTLHVRTSSLHSSMRHLQTGKTYIIIVSTMEGSSSSIRISGAPFLPDYLFRIALLYSFDSSSSQIDESIALTIATSLLL